MDEIIVAHRFVRQSFKEFFTPENRFTQDYTFQQKPVFYVFSSSYYVSDETVFLIYKKNCSLKFDPNFKLIYSAYKFSYVLVKRCSRFGEILIGEQLLWWSLFASYTVLEGFLTSLYVADNGGDFVFAEHWDKKYFLRFIFVFKNVTNFSGII